MSVSVSGSTVTLSGRCGVEDAEQLLLALQDAPDSLVDLSGATRLHTAVIQVLLAVGPPLFGTPEDPFIREFILLGATMR